MALSIKEAMYLAQTQGLVTLCEGWVWSALEGERTRRTFLVLRPPFLFLFERHRQKRVETAEKDQTHDAATSAETLRKAVHLTTLIDVTVQQDDARIKGLLSALNGVSLTDADRERASAEPAPSTIRFLRQGRIFLTMIPIDVRSDVWLSALRSACEFKLFPATEVQDTEVTQGDVSPRPAIPVLSLATEPRSDAAALKLPSSIREQLRQELHFKEERIKMLVHQNLQLQISMDAATKASGELLDQKNAEVRWVESKVHRLLEEQKKLRQEVYQLRQLLQEKTTVLLATSKKLAHERQRCESLVNEVHNSKDKDKGQLVVQLMRKRDVIQDLVIKNRRLRDEVSAGAQHFEKLHRNFLSQISMLTNAIEASDAVDLVRRRLQLALLIVTSFRRHSGAPVTHEEKKQLEARIVELQRDIRFKEACAKSQYIKFRSMLLNHQLESMRGSVKETELYDCMRRILERYAWILQEDYPPHSGMSSSSHPPLDGQRTTPVEGTVQHSLLQPVHPPAWGFTKPIEPDVIMLPPHLLLLTLGTTKRFKKLNDPLSAE